MKLIVYILIFLPLFTFGQPNIDSLQLIWEDESLAKEERLDAADQLLKDKSVENLKRKKIIAADFEKLAKELNNSKYTLLSYFYQGRYNILTGDYELSSSYFEKVIDISLAINDTSLLLGGHNGLAISKMNLGRYEESIDHFLISLNLLKNHDDEDVKGDVFNNLGAVFYYLENYTKSGDYFLKALESYRQRKKWNNVIASYINVFTVYNKQGDNKRSLMYQDSCLQLMNKVDHSLLWEANFYKSKGDYHVGIGDTLLGVSYIRKGLEISQRIGHEKNIVNCLFDLAKCQKGDSAIIMANEALRIAKNIQLQYLISNVAEFLYQTYKSKGMMEEALDMLELTGLDIDNNEIYDKFGQYEYDEKVELNQTNYGLNLNKEKEKYKIYVYCIIALFLTLIIFVLALLRRTNKKNETEKKALLDKIILIKKDQSSEGKAPQLVLQEDTLLSKEKIEEKLDVKLNETDWKILNILYEKPSSSNREIAEFISLSLEGTRSSLKKMYRLFEIESAHNMRLTLILKAITFSK